MAIRVVVSGLGERGRDWARQLHASPEFDLVGGVDVDAGALRGAASMPEMPDGQLFEDLDTALERTRGEAVVVATAEDAHTAACETAIERGCAVLVEKPFALRLSEARRVVDLAEEAGVPVVVGQNHRYLRSQRAVRRLIAEGALGPVRTVVCQYYRGSPDTQPVAGLSPAILWRTSVHHIDALRWVLGQDVTGVLARSYSAPENPLEGASVQTLLDFDGGARGLYSGTYESSGHEYFERGQEFYERFVGQRATLHVFHRWLVLCARGKLPRLVRRGPRPVTEEVILLDQLRRAILHGEEPDSSGRANLQTMATLEACARSTSEGRWIDPQEVLRES